ncbi:hypothetical protein T265_07099 [Opisthorchis viverrini]|uniref:Uncharacterized protein n=1 Tax=Opisthorchis viverrini TaxID=6198 RepID=A0A074ZI06_OPIVI|nr:hypothetical protein T265_07099 [Opisthorchis viverrini]KER25417.1 hypothetical protein T265_07099 [Opisthorchis viverrini]
MAGVRNADLKAKFRRRVDRTPRDTLHIARTYENPYDSGDPSPNPAPLFPTAQRHRQDIWTPTEAKPNPEVASTVRASERMPGSEATTLITVSLRCPRLSSVVHDCPHRFY